MKEITKCDDVLNMLKDFSSKGITPTDDDLTVDFNFTVEHGIEGEAYKILPPVGENYLFIEKLFGNKESSEDIVHWKNVAKCIDLSIRKLIDNLFDDEDSNSIGKLDKSRTLISYYDDFKKIMTGGGVILLIRNGKHVPEYVGGRVNTLMWLLNQYSKIRDYVKHPSSWSQEHLPLKVAKPFGKLIGISVSIDSLLKNVLGRLNMLDLDGSIGKIITPISTSHIDKDYLLHKILMCKNIEDLVDEYESMYEALDLISRYINYDSFRFNKEALANVKGKRTVHTILSLLSKEIQDAYFKKNRMKFKIEDSDFVNKYTKKPIEVEAIQLTKDNQERVHNFVGKSLTFNKYGAVIKTLEGEMSCEFGDYIIKGVKGEFYPCKKEIFEETYN
jgi:hypothetical protein